MKTMHSFALAGALALVLALAGCDGDSGDDGGADVAGGADTTAVEDGHAHDEDPVAATAEDACVHFQTGPFEAVQLGAAVGATAPEITVGHHVHTVSAVVAGEEGQVQLTVAEDAEYLFAASRDIALTIESEGGDALTVEDTPDLSEHCAAIAKAFVFDLAPGTYYITLMPAADVDEFDLYVSAVGTHDHDTDHEHE